MTSDGRLGYGGTDSSGAIAYTQGLLSSKRKWCQPLSDDDWADIENCLEIASRNRRAELRKEWGCKDD